MRIMVVCLVGARDKKKEKKTPRRAEGVDFGDFQNTESLVTLAPQLLGSF